MSQLEMIRHELNDLPEVTAPEGYCFRTYQPGDEIHWARIMEGNVGTGWTVEKVRANLVDKPQFSPEALFFAVRDGLPVGTACAWRKPPEETVEGYVHMVAVVDEHRGHRLGYWLSLLTLHYFKDHGFSHARLQTDDNRLAAIKCYLDLGFQPHLTADDHRERWQHVGWQLGRDVFSTFEK